MNYDSIIIEMISRIQALEEKVQELSAGDSPAAAPVMQATAPAAPVMQAAAPAAPAASAGPKVSTPDIRDYIVEQKRLAAESGEPVLILKAGDIHRALHMKNRIPMVTNAMRQCMSEGDEVLHDTPSGKSSTLEIKYYLTGTSEERPPSEAAATE